MKTLIIGDLHGNYNALCDILQRAGAMDENEMRLPGWRIISVGDVVNCAPRGVKYRGFYPDDFLMLKRVYDRGLIDEICVGNHELFYTHNRESGRFGGMAWAAHEMRPGLVTKMKELVGEGIYKAATTAHGWLVSHAGVAPNFQKSGEAETPEQWAAFLNGLLESGKSHSLIDAAGWSVGAAGVGGIVWFRPSDLIATEEPKEFRDIVRDIGPERLLPQIVGHTPTRSGVPEFMDTLNTWFIDGGRYVDGIGSGIIWNGDSWEPVGGRVEEHEAVETV